MANGIKKECENCNMCCKHVIFELQKPANKEDYDEIIWFLSHKGIKVYIDEEGGWNAEARNECKYLKDGKCSIYNERPQICRDYDPEDCELHGEGEYYARMFETPEEFIKYMEENNMEHIKFG